MPLRVLPVLVLLLSVPGAAVAQARDEGAAIAALVARAARVPVRADSLHHHRVTPDGRTIAMLETACNVRRHDAREPIGDDCLRLGLALVRWAEFRDASPVFLRACALGNLVGCELAVEVEDDPESAAPTLSSALVQDCDSLAGDFCAEAEIEAMHRIAQAPDRRRAVMDALVTLGLEESVRWSPSTMQGMLRVLEPRTPRAGGPRSPSLFDRRRQRQRNGGR